MSKWWLVVLITANKMWERGRWSHDYDWSSLGYRGLEGIMNPAYIKLFQYL